MRIIIGASVLVTVSLSLSLGKHAINSFIFYIEPIILFVLRNLIVKCQALNCQKIFLSWMARRFWV